MQNIKIKLNNILNKYQDALLQSGLKIHISKKYFEKDVDERYGSHGEGQQILNLIDKALDRKREKKYNYERNRYHCIVLTVIPADDSLDRTECRDYAFVFKKVERAHIGDKPLHYSYREEKLLLKIEKRIQKLIKKASSRGAKSICKDTMIDAFRYALHNKYHYKRRILGKDSYFFQTLFFYLCGILAISLVIFLWIASA